MTVPVRCDCGNFFTVEARLSGGYANCPRCGQATPVPGLRDPIWRLLQGLALVGWVAAVVVTQQAFGPGAAVIVGAAAAALIWILSKAL